MSAYPAARPLASHFPNPFRSGHEQFAFIDGVSPRLRGRIARAENRHALSVPKELHFASARLDVDLQPTIYMIDGNHIKSRERPHIRGGFISHKKSRLDSGQGADSMPKHWDDK
jgi:hypothetical protein